MTYQIPTRKPDLVLINHENRSCHLGDLGGKRKEIENIEKCLNLAKKRYSLWNMNVTVIPILVGTLETFNKGLEKGV